MSKIKLDFTGVESFQTASEGEHVCKIAKAELKQSQGGNDMIVVAYEVIKGDDKGARVFENYPLIETALWKLKGMLQAIGLKADGKVQLDLDRLIGKTCIVAVTHEEYEGKIRARVADVMKVKAAAEEDEVDEDIDEEEDEESTPAKKKAAPKKESKKAPMNPPASDDDEDDDDDWDDEDEEEEEEEKPAPKKKVAKKEAPAPKKKAAKKPEPEEDEDDDDDDWDEE